MDMDRYKCPITRKIMLDPVIACDGYIYEKDAILSWLYHNNISPITGLTMDNILIEAVVIKNEIKLFMEKLYNKNFNINYCIDIKDIITNLNNYNIQKIYNATLINCNYIEILNKNIISNLNNYSELFKKIIDLTDNLEYKDNNNWKLIHYICQYSTPEMIKYIINKGVDLECETKTGYRPIHFICEYSTREMVKYIMGKGVNLKFVNNDLHIIEYMTTPNKTRFINVLLGSYILNNNNSNLIKKILMYGNEEDIKYLINKLKEYKLNSYYYIFYLIINNKINRKKIIYELYLKN
jgi:ankyrin repeat protein